MVASGLFGHPARVAVRLPRGKPTPDPIQGVIAPDDPRLGAGVSAGSPNAPPATDTAVAKTGPEPAALAEQLRGIIPGEAASLSTEHRDMRQAVSIRVLVVEDDAMTRASVSDILWADCATVTSLPSGVEVPLLLMAGDEAARFLMVDVNPGGTDSGFDLTHMAHAHWPGIMVIYVAGNLCSMVRDVLGPRDLCLLKPFTDEALRRLMQTVANHGLVGAGSSPRLSLRGRFAVDGRLPEGRRSRLRGYFSAKAFSMT